MSSGFKQSPGSQGPSRVRRVSLLASSPFWFQLRHAPPSRPNPTQTRLRHRRLSNKYSGQQPSGIAQSKQSWPGTSGVDTGYTSQVEVCEPYTGKTAGRGRPHSGDCCMPPHRVVRSASRRRRSSRCCWTPSRLRTRSYAHPPPLGGLTPPVFV